MEMPENCGNCFFCDDWAKCQLLNLNNIFDYCKDGIERSAKCPLVPLPEGYGDLIDRDALKKRTPMVIDYSAGGFGTDGSIRPVRGYGDWQIDQAPTIVPAEGGGEDG